jgi:hypothetical protein
MSASQLSQSGSTPEQDHRRQALWQIYLPTFLGAGVFLALCIWVILFTIGYVPDPGLPDQQTPAAKVAVIWILMPACLGGLIQLAVLGGVVYGLASGIRGLPPLAHKAKAGLDRASAFLRSMQDRIAAPVIAAGSAKTGLDRFFEMIAFWKHFS